ncbi:hypothetical protein [Mesorhizobium sp. 43Arga]
MAPGYKATRSNTSVCLSFTDADVAALDADGHASGKEPGVLQA